MAEQLNPESANQQSNAKARDEAIREAMEALYQKDKAIEALIVEHIDDLRQDKRDIKKRMSGDYEISVKLLNARYSAYKIERKAADNNDDTVADQLRELWDACPPGSQVNMMDAVTG